MARRGRPPNDDDFFAMEVHRVMRAYECGVRAACQKIARGKERDKVPLSPDGTKKRWTLGSPWKDTNAETLEWRYFAWKRREEARQAAQSLTIEFPQ
jgi:hypothetical protein